MATKSKAALTIGPPAATHWAKSQRSASEVAHSYAALLERLETECQERGRAQLISRAIGITPQHLCRVRKGKANLGELFARALAEYWGLDFRAVNDAAEPTAGSPETLPNLRAALEFCRDVYPGKFLKHVEPLARRQERDRRKPTWVAWLESNFGDWKEGQRRKRGALEPEQSGTYSWGDEDEAGGGAKTSKPKAGF